MTWNRCPWLRRASKRHADTPASEEPTKTPPPYTERQNQGTTLTGAFIAISPVSPDQRAVILSAAHACTSSSSAITARALAENPDGASAMANALEQIKRTTTNILAARGITSDSSTAASIWAVVLDYSARQAREIADRPHEPGFASQEASRLEGMLARGIADEAAVDHIKNMGVMGTR